MASSESLYPGANYGFDPELEPTFGIRSEYGEFQGYRTPASNIGLAIDARTANQLREVSAKTSSGARLIEVQGVSPEILESIPDQHLKEINRLKKLAGVELTFHGPLVEATGIGREGWDESKREQAERQMFSAVERGHKMNPEGNLVITFHTTSGLPEMKTRIKTKEGEKIKEIWVVDERDGNFAPLKPKENVLTGEKADPYEELKRLNTENWFKRLSQASFHAIQGKDVVSEASLRLRKALEDADLAKRLTQEDIINLYKKSKTVEGTEFLNKLEKKNPLARKIAENEISRINHSEIYIRDAYNELQTLFNQAWDAAKKDNKQEDLAKLQSFKDEIKNKLNWIGDPEKLPNFADTVVQGVNVLNTLSNPPQSLRPLQDFALDKASDTFSNIALNSFEKFGETSPIISLENPPAGGGLSRADDIRELIEKSRKKFVDKAQENLGLSAEEAKSQAEKLIGATWDVGHINMIRKFGYKDKDIIKETEKIAPFVKHVHLSDNFGYEHTELPMGMGNVPTKEHMEIIAKYNDKVKKIIEAGNWYQHFQVSPLPQTFEAFGSPIYALKKAPYWNQQIGLTGEYFSGYGAIFPEVHFQTYGGGFAGLPPELGGQTPRRGFAGTPAET